MSGCSRWNFADGLPETSNCYCHPGIAGGSPAYASLVSVHKRMIFWPESIALGDELGRLGAISFAVAVAWADPAVYFLKIGIRVRPGLGQSR